jgi:hypothetical protein
MVWCFLWSWALDRRLCLCLSIHVWALVQISQRRAHSDVLRLWRYMRTCYSYVQQVLWSQRYVLYMCLISLQRLLEVCSSVQTVVTVLIPNAPISQRAMWVSVEYIIGIGLQSVVHRSTAKHHSIRGSAVVYRFTAVTHMQQLGAYYSTLVRVLRSNPGSALPPKFSAPVF